MFFAMKIATLLIILYWSGVSGTFGDKTHPKNETTTAKQRTSGQDIRRHLSQGERNRRLIPYANYYVAGTSDYTNSITPHNEDSGDNTTPKPRTQTSTLKQPYRSENEYYDYPDNVEYSYIPIAYIPGGRGINYNPDSHYYPNSYFQNPISTENSKLYSTPKPKYYATGSTEKKFPFSYLTDYVQQNVLAQDYYNSYVTPANIKHKPGYYPDASISVTTPQTEYLNFRYSLYKTQAPKYDVTTTPATIEITSPKNYLVNKVVSTTYPHSNQHNHVTASYAVTYDYPDDQYAYTTPSAYIKTPKTLAKTPEPMTQSTKTHMTIMKSQELPYQHATPARIQYVQKPYLIPTLATSHDLNVDDLFNGYNINKQLPDRITPDNIKQSIKTLSYILQVLQKADSISHYHKPPNFNSKQIFDSLTETHSLSALEHNSVSPVPLVDDYDIYNSGKEQISAQLFPTKTYKEEQSTPGRAGIDYPTYSVIPETSFSCKTQRYKGFFADPDTKCQVWHYCDLNGGQASFLCPNGTIFNQAALTCDWWFNVKCASTAQLYVLNERLYKYILPVRPSFPEDYSGPLVDQYLTEKFKELESTRKHKYPTNSTTSKNETNLTELDQYEIPSHLLSENL